MFAIGNAVNTESPARHTCDEISARLWSATREFALLLIHSRVSPTWDLHRSGAESVSTIRA
jgi:hypothetical protein